jgi:hypothetical protein
MEEFVERPGASPFIQKRKQFADDRLDALSQWGVYSLVAVGIGVGVIVVAQVTSGQDPRSLEWFNPVFALVFIVGAICAVVALGNGALALWAWSTIAFRSVLKGEAYPFQRYWRRPYGPRVAIIVLVIVASVPAVYFRFHNSPLFFGMLLLVALIGKRIVSKF